MYDVSCENVLYFLHANLFEYDSSGKSLLSLDNTVQQIFDRDRRYLPQHSRGRIRNFTVRGVLAKGAAFKNAIIALPLFRHRQRHSVSLLQHLIVPTGTGAWWARLSQVTLYQLTRNIILWAECSAQRTESRAYTCGRDYSPGCWTPGAIASRIQRPELGSSCGQRLLNKPPLTATAR